MAWKVALWLKSEMVRDVRCGVLKCGSGWGLNRMSGCIVVWFCVGYGLRAVGAESVGGAVACVVYVWLSYVRPILALLAMLRLSVVKVAKVRPGCGGAVV